MPNFPLMTYFHTYWITTALAVICRWWRLLARIEMQSKAHVILIEKLQTPVGLLAPSKKWMWQLMCQDVSFDHVTLCDLITFYDKQQHKTDPVTHTYRISALCMSSRFERLVMEKNIKLSVSAGKLFIKMWGKES